MVFMSELIDVLKARAAAANTSYVRQTVDIDIVTYEKVVLFIEEEGCNLKEGLRRAVRIGVEALLLERMKEPPMLVEDYAPSFVTPPVPGYYIGHTQYSPSEIDIDAEVASDAPAEGDFTRIAPPGLG
jgi:hypothetical protein